MRPKRPLHLLAFVEAQQSSIDKHTGELVADGPMDEGSRDGGVDASGEAADDASIPDRVSNLCNFVIDERARRP